MIAAVQTLTWTEREVYAPIYIYLERAVWSYGTFITDDMALKNHKKYPRNNGELPKRVVRLIKNFNEF